MARLDLNADLAEGFGTWSLTDDDALLEVVTSANVACGFHAGDPATMRRVCTAAVERGVAVGAQVSYRDLAGFGRRFIDAHPDELTADLLYQVGALREFTRAAGGEVAYLKPHGALYNAVVHHDAQARAVVAAAREAGLPVLGLPGSRFLARAQEAGLTTYAEAFGDRGYTPEGTLVPRSEPGALLPDADAVVERARRLAVDQVIVAVDGTEIPVDAASLCLHGDSPDAVDAARRVAEALRDAGVTLGPFA
ncbi:LamB/YcsF family protein [Actinomycetospora straminea]|uniref:5-oxoprolinase subunit A n=1 Tax=Actinomycetospora straminea TaxID=663607 RepID=A0ABP9F3C9_9PSEU|nr:5-oxoprolinase subunit PxpA [Actinomycetospora straminea]MDD7931748.1 LamB/YcsF family protein [Actinomycetospora straminea]